MMKALNKGEVHPGLPEFCYGALPSEQSLPPGQQQVTRVVRGETGYLTTAEFGGWERAAELNADLGVTPAQVEAMFAGSMFGFHVPGANPAVYDDTGKLK